MTEYVFGADKTCPLDLRQIPDEKLPTPPEGWEWFKDPNHVGIMLSEEVLDYPSWYVSWDLPGGTMTCHADVDVVAWFIDALRSLGGA